MSIKLFTLRQTKTQSPKADPRSHKFVDAIKGMLKEQGMEQPRALNECSHRLLKIAINFFKHLSPGDDYTVEEVSKLEVRFRTALTEYGIEEEEQQDKIFVKFFGTLNELGAGGLKG